MEANNNEQEEEKVPGEGGGEGEGEGEGEELPPVEEDVPVASGSELSMIKLKDLMTKVNAGWESGQCPITIYTEMYFEWTRLFRHFGNAVAVAFKDITDKANTINANQKTLIELNKIAADSPEG
jgi:hypothetical protein